MLSLYVNPGGQLEERQQRERQCGVSQRGCVNPAKVNSFTYSTGFHAVTYALYYCCNHAYCCTVLLLLTAAVKIHAITHKSKHSTSCTDILTRSALLPVSLHADRDRETVKRGSGVRRQPRRLVSSKRKRRISQISIPPSTTYRNSVGVQGIIHSRSTRLPGLAADAPVLVVGRDYCTWLSNKRASWHLYPAHGVKTFHRMK